MHIQWEASCEVALARAIPDSEARIAVREEIESVVVMRAEGEMTTGSGLAIRCYRIAGGWTVPPLRVFVRIDGLATVTLLTAERDTSSRLVAPRRNSWCR